jgi:transposase-like protein
VGIEINIDGNKATLRGLELLGKEDPRWRQVEVRARRYLNNVVEQDVHRQATTRPLWSRRPLKGTGHSIVEPIVSPEHFCADEECRCTKHAAPLCLFSRRAQSCFVGI